MTISIYELIGIITISYILGVVAERYIQNPLNEKLYNDSINESNEEIKTTKTSEIYTDSNTVKQESIFDGGFKTFKDDRGVCIRCGKVDYLNHKNKCMFCDFDDSCD